MILHLIDDEKIAPRTIELFEKALPNQNFFVCFRMPVQRIVPSDRIVYEDQIEGLDFGVFSKVFIHYLSDRKRAFYNKYIKKEIETYWFVWGGDIYNDLMTSRGFNTYYEPLYGGVRLFIKNRLAKAGIKPYFKDNLRFIKEHVNYMLTIPEEYKLFRKYLNDYLPPHCDIEFFYYPIDKIIGQTLLEKWCDVDSRKIVVGNCATVSNNHCYAFKYLKSCSLEGFTIVPVLSYGGTKKYVDHVNEEGKKYFGEAYQPQLSFLPIDEYNAFMCQSSFYVYGNWRQEAVGNIVIALYMGAKVFLSKKSPLLEFYRNKGLAIYELEQMDSKSLLPLSDELRAKNRELMLHNYNEALLMERIRKVWSE